MIRSDASAFDQSAQAFLTTGLQQYHGLIAEIKAKYSGTAVGATESIFSYLAPALGLNLITPYSYLKAVSEGTEISAADEATVEQQISQQQIKVLVYNSQNTPNNIQAVITLAKAHNIPDRDDHGDADAGGRDVPGVAVGAAPGDRGGAGAGDGEVGGRSGDLTTEEQRSRRAEESRGEVQREGTEGDGV